MTDIVGVLGQSTTATVGSVTAYTCPSGKTAKVKLQFIGLAASGGASTLAISVNGAEIMYKSITAAYYVWSSSAALAKMANATKPDGTAAADTVAPCPAEYYLDEGDSISYTVGTTAFQAFNFQVVGVELDKA